MKLDLIPVKNSNILEESPKYFSECNSQKDCQSGCVDSCLNVTAVRIIWRILIFQILCFVLMCI